MRSYLRNEKRDNKDARLVSDFARWFYSTNSQKQRAKTIKEVTDQDDAKKQSSESHHVLEVKEVEEHIKLQKNHLIDVAKAMAKQRNDLAPEELVSIFCEK